MTLLEKILLQLRRRWALILSLVFGTDVPNVVRKGGSRIVPLDGLLLLATLVLRGKSSLNP